MSAEDVELLIRIFHQLVDKGHSVLVVEHHLHLLAACDWLIELGPKGGEKGGYIIAEGTPEELMQENTPTTPYLKEILEEQQ
jgi:excinuclease ABC subunit A